MIQVGKSITMPGDTLQKTNVEYLYHAIRNPKNEILNKIRHLRIVKSLDDRQYAQLKKRLPYFVCGIFNPNVRRTENFAYTTYFVIDIDHVSEKGISMETMRRKIEADERVLVSFLSPGEDGLKVMFKLKERCYDAGIFSLFYKKFLYDFSRQHHLDQVIDRSTSDVTRACFISYDPDIYYNSQAKEVEIKTYIDTGNAYEMFREKATAEKMEREHARSQQEGQPPRSDVDANIINQVKSILKTAPPKKEKPPVYVPEELNEIMSELQDYIVNAGVVIREVKAIQYGKKIKALFGKKEAEVNLFYGKRGFTVVQSPRTGTTQEMNQLLADLVEAFLAINS